MRSSKIADQETKHGRNALPVSYTVRMKSKLQQPYFAVLHLVLTNAHVVIQYEGYYAENLNPLCVFLIFKFILAIYERGTSTRINTLPPWRFRKQIEITKY